MKGNIKKLALVVVIAAIPMLIAVATASAVGQTIQGNYAITGYCTTLISMTGFNTSLQPNGGAWFTQSGSWEGVLTFNKDGTGSYTGIEYNSEVYAPGMNLPPDSSSSNSSYGFTYTIDDGDITFTYVTGSFEADFTSGPNVPGKGYITIPQPWGGTISSDGKSIHVWWGVLIEMTADKANTTPTGMQGMSNATFHGFEVNE